MHTLGFVSQILDSAEFHADMSTCPECGGTDLRIALYTKRVYCEGCGSQYPLAVMHPDGTVLPPVPCRFCGEALHFGEHNVECGGPGEGACLQRHTGVSHWTADDGTIALTLRGNDYRGPSYLGGVTPHGFAVARDLSIEVTPEEREALSDSAVSFNPTTFRGVKIFPRNLT